MVKLVADINEETNELPALSGKMVRIKDSLFAEDVIEIPVELNDGILNRYAAVENFQAAKKTMIEATKNVTGLMHRFENLLPKDPDTKEPVIVVAGIEARLNLEQKEKLTTTKVKTDE